MTVWIILGRHFPPPPVSSRRDDDAEDEDDEVTTEVVMAELALRWTQAEDNSRNAGRGGVSWRPRDMIHWGQHCLGPWRPCWASSQSGASGWRRRCCGFNSRTTAYRVPAAARRFCGPVRRRLFVTAGICGRADVALAPLSSKADCGLMNWRWWRLIARSNEQPANINRIRQPLSLIAYRRNFVFSRSIFCHNDYLSPSSHRLRRPQWML